MDRKNINWGILGVGFIADVFASDLALVDDCEVVAVASRSMDRAKAFADKHQVKNAYDSYQALMDDPQVDAIYIASHNNYHKEQTIMCLEAKKAVLCEKPMALNYIEAKEMIDTSKRTGQLFIEGHWTRFKPTTKKLREMVNTGILGDIRYVSSSFGYMSEPNIDVKDRRMNKDLGGGALYDVGVYPLAMDNMLFRSWPDRVFSNQILGNTGVDLQSKASFVYGEAMVDIHCAINAQTPFTTYISGTKGSVNIEDSWFGNSMTITDADGHQELYQFESWGKNYTFEIEAFNEAFRQGKTEVEEITHQDSLEIMRMVDYIYKH